MAGTSKTMTFLHSKLFAFFFFFNILSFVRDKIQNENIGNNFMLLFIPGGWIFTR